MPVIVQKWPRAEFGSPRVVIRIQQDGPSSHILLFTQPPNSPDLNILDLGLNRALSAKQEKKNCTDVEELIRIVEEVYRDYPNNPINKIYITLMTVTKEIVRSNGDNNYKIPHLRKDALARRGVLPKCIEVANEALEYLDLV